MKSGSPLPNRKFYVSADIELFYEKMAHIDNDVDQITVGIKNILDKNHISQTCDIS